MPIVTIPLTQGQSTILEEADYDLVRPYTWYALRYRNGYYAVAKGYYADGRRAVIGMHRVILDAPAGVWVDHINGDPLDNRRCNLRLADASESAANQRRPDNNTSGFKGVTFKGGAFRRKPWCASIRKDHRLHHIGYYATPQEAALAYDAAARALFGPFARCNFQER